MQPTNPAHGGAATPDRQCQFTKSNGFRCEDWALRGHQHCFRHHQYLAARPDIPIDVPLLEDEDALISLLSQTLRALAQGTIPTANGRAILAGCRIMQNILTRRLAQAKFHVKLTRLGSPAATDAAADALFGPRPADQPPADSPAPVEDKPQAAPKPVQRSAEAEPVPVRHKSGSAPPPAAAPSSKADPRTSNVRKTPPAPSPADEQMKKVRFPDRAQPSNPFVIPQGVPLTSNIEQRVAMQASAAR